MDDGSIQLCSRNIAVIYYLTKDWSAADGGALIDLEAPGGPQTHIPQFNRYEQEREGRGRQERDRVARAAQSAGDRWQSC